MLLGKHVHEEVFPQLHAWLEQQDTPHAHERRQRGQQAVAAEILGQGMLNVRSRL